MTARRLAAVLPALLAAVLTAGCGPQGPMGVFPGGPLSGTSVDGPVLDWAFTAEHALVAIETRGRWLDHSVTVVCAAHGGHLYLPSRNAQTKRWVQNVLRDPRVRIGVGDEVYEGRAVRVTESEPGNPVERAFLRKYYGLEVEEVRFLYESPAPGDDRAEVWLFRIDPLEPPA